MTKADLKKLIAYQRQYVAPYRPTPIRRNVVLSGDQYRAYHEAVKIFLGKENGDRPTTSDHILLLEALEAALASRADD